MRRARKWSGLLGSLLGTCLATTIVCDIPAYDVWYNPGYVIVDDCCGDYYYDDCCGGFWFDWWWW